MISDVLVTVSRRTDGGQSTEQLGQSGCGARVNSVRTV
jgi:hypothetical protein